MIFPDGFETTYKTLWDASDKEIDQLEKAHGGWAKSYWSQEKYDSQVGK